jgi:hypothetical protein
MPWRRPLQTPSRDGYHHLEEGEVPDVQISQGRPAYRAAHRSPCRPPPLGVSTPAVLAGAAGSRPSFACRDGGAACPAGLEGPGRPHARSGLGSRWPTQEVTPRDRSLGWLELASAEVTCSERDLPPLAPTSAAAARMDWPESNGGDKAGQALRSPEGTPYRAASRSPRGTTPGAIALTCNQIAVALRSVGDWPRRSRWSCRRRRHRARARACHYQRQAAQQP